MDGNVRTTGVSESIAPNVVFNRERRRIQESLLFLKDKAATLKADTAKGTLALSTSDQELVDSEYKAVINALERIHSKLTV